MKCIIIDDEPHAIALLENFIKQFPDIELGYTTTDALDALSYLNQNTSDLIFLDINMPQISGIDFLKLAKNTGITADFVLTTAYSEYALEGYEYQVLDYLLKPIAFERFTLAVQKAISANKKKKLSGSDVDDYFFVKVDSKNKTVKINISDIQYIEGLKNYASIFTKDGRIVTMITMHQLERRLEQAGFFRTHRSYIIPIKNIKLVEGNRIFLRAVDEPIPLGESYKIKFAKLLENNSI